MPVDKTCVLYGALDTDKIGFICVIAGICSCVVFYQDY